MRTRFALFFRLFFDISKAEPKDGIILEAQEEKKVDLANAIDLSESEDEEEMEDIINDFALQEEDMDVVGPL